MKKLYLILIFIISLQADIIKEDKSELVNLCEKNDSVSCVKLGAYYDLVEKNNEKGLIYYKKSCELSLGIGCFVVGNNYHNNKNYEMAKKYFKKGCLLGDDGSCVMYNKILYNSFSFRNIIDNNDQILSRNLVKKQSLVQSRAWSPQKNYSNLNAAEKQYYVDILNYVFQAIS